LKDIKPNKGDSKMEIFIVDDNKVFRDMLKYFISETPDMTVVAEACDGDEAVAMASKNDFDLVILDIAMPGKSGLDVLHELKRMKPYMPILMLSMFPEEHYELSVMNDGADGYVRKDNMVDQLIEAVQRILHGGKYFNIALPEEWGGNFGFQGWNA
jgi:two-component system, NarL family, invasion response regulator UvrY